MGSCCSGGAHNDKNTGDGSQCTPSSSQQTPSLKTFSSASQIPTDELTLIYNLPSNKFQTAEQVIQSHGYKLLYQVAKGGFAKIYKTKRLSDDTIIACKVLDLTNDIDYMQRTDTKNELFVMERTDHPNIIKLFEHFMIRDSTNYDKEKVFVYIFMQWAQGDTLSKLMREIKEPLTESRAKEMFAQIVAGVRHMHQKGIAHRDLKMGNILLDDKQNALISDFGLSRVANRVSKGGTVMSFAFCGTIPYMAPEVLVNRTSKRKEYNPFGADIWALGIILYCMINKAYPFDERLGFEAMIECQNRSKWKFSRYVKTEPSQQLCDILNKMLEPDCSKRISIGELADHYWIRDDINKIVV